MKNNLMRILSLFLVVSICLCLLSISAFAEDQLNTNVEAVNTNTTVVQLDESTAGAQDAADTQNIELSQMSAVATDPLYGYKIGFDDSSEILSHIGWRGVGYPYRYTKTSDGKQGPDILDENGNKIPFDTAPDPGANEASYGIGPGLYGNALSVNFYGSYIDKDDTANQYGSVIHFTIPATKVLVKDAIGNDPAIYKSIGDAMSGFKTLGFWVKGVKESAEDRTLDAKGQHTVTVSATRSFKLGILTDGFNFSTNVTIPRTEEWQYVMIPVENLKSGTDTFISKPDQFAKVTGIEIAADTYRNGFFGASPVKQGDSYKPWVDSITIDEMVFDKNSANQYATVRPSIGEVSYYRNSNLKSVSVDGYNVYDKDVNAGDDITITLPYTFNLANPVDKLRVVATPECPNFPGSNTKQIQSGAVAIINYPDALPGKGSIVVTAASGEQTTYNDINFVKGTPLVIDQKFNLPTTLTSGKKLVSFIVKNYDTQPKDIFVVATLENKTTGALYQIATASQKQVAGGALSNRLNLTLNVPNVTTDELKNYVAHYYFYDNVINMNQTISPITIKAVN